MILQWLTDNIILVFFACSGIFVFLKMRGRNKQNRRGKAKLKRAIKHDLNEPVSLHPDIDTSLCIGCGACTRACPEGQILQLINHKAVLVAPTKCIGHGECEAACPMGAIDLVFGTKSRGMDIPRLSTNYETNVPGLFIIGELGGMGLIRNATKQGTLAARHALKDLPSQKADVDVAIVGAGPAGIAATLYAISKEKTYVLIEQNKFGGTIANFPRQKLVMSHPFGLPIVGEAKFKDNTVSKEELISYFHQVRKDTGLKLQESTRFDTVEKKGEIFVVKTSRGEFTAKRVVLAIGVRGTPRKLGVPGEDMKKVTYNLIDPEQYKGKKIVVVGGGNAGAETAIMLSDPKLQNQVRLLIMTANFDRANEENIRKAKKLEKEGALKIWFNTRVEAIQEKNVLVVREGEKENFENDFVFVLAGAEMPHKFLMSLGIKFEKKFGQGLKEAL
jgi:thioredoxin reductase (NADPH)